MKAEALISAIGLPGVVLGAAVDCEAAAFFGGLLAHRGMFGFEPVALAATAGAALGDQALYFAGRLGGETALARRLLDSPRAQPLRRRIAARPAAMSALARVLYGLHGLATLALGAHRVPWPVFTLANLCAAELWAHLWALGGFAASQALERAFGRLPLHHLLLAVVVLAVVSLALAGWYLGRRARR